MNDDPITDSPYEWRNHELYQGDNCLGVLIIGEMSGFSFSDKLEQIEEGVFKWTRRFNTSTDQPVPLQRFVVSFQTTYETTWHMIPSVSYNGN
jgi:hypothetical protein